MGARRKNRTSNSGIAKSNPRKLVKVSRKKQVKAKAKQRKNQNKSRKNRRRNLKRRKPPNPKTKVLTSKKTYKQ